MVTEAPVGEAAPLIPASLIPLRDVPKHLPHASRKLSYVSLWRWVNKGVRGQKLRIVRVGGTPCTTEAWLMEFFDGITQAGHAPSPTKVRTPLRRERDVLRTRKRLAEIGI